MRGVTAAGKAERGRVNGLFRDCLATAIRHGYGRNDGEALLCVTFQYILRHREEVRRLVEGSGPGMRFQDFCCQLPGCGRSAEHLHRVRCSGGDPQGRLRALCALHHEQGRREGHLRVSSGGQEVVLILGEQLVPRPPPGPARKPTR